LRNWGVIETGNARGVKIYVELPDEFGVWCPVEAVNLGGDVYQIIEVNADPDTRWAFNTGAKVKCRSKLTSERQTILVACEEVLP
jgi:hypothetical protein